MSTLSIKVKKEFLNKEACMEAACKIANPIDMQDGGDKSFRRLIFAASWIMTKGKK